MSCEKKKKKKGKKTSVFLLLFSPSQKKKFFTHTKHTDIKYQILVIFIRRTKDTLYIFIIIIIYK